MHLDSTVVMYAIVFNIFSKAGFLNSGTIDIQGWILVHSGDCLTHLRMFSIILTLHPLETSNTHPLPSHDLSPDIAKCVPKSLPIENHCSKPRMSGLRTYEPHASGTQRYQQRDALTKCYFKLCQGQFCWEKGQEKDEELGQTGFQSYDDWSKHYYQKHG